VAIAAGGTHSLALKDDGTVTFWGDYSSYYYSSGRPSTNVPPAVSNVVAIAAQNDCSFVVRSDGNLIAWGTSYYQITNVLPQATNAVRIASGYGNILAMLGNSPLRTDVQSMNWRIVDNQFRVSIVTRSARVYRLEYKNDLSSTQWTALPLVASRDGILELIDANPLSNQRFYRVRQW